MKIQPFSPTHSLKHANKGTTKSVEINESNVADDHVVFRSRAQHFLPTSDVMT